MYKLLLIAFLFSGNLFAQDTLVVDDGSIWFTRSSCSVDFRCYKNIEQLVNDHLTDSTCILYIELKENVFEKARENYTDCRAERLAAFFRAKHNQNIKEVVATSILMNASEMRTAMAEQNYRTIILVIGDKPEETNTLTTKEEGE
jgi:hypothetical protein